LSRIAGIEIVVGRIDHHQRRGARGKARHDCGMRAARRIVHELDQKALMRVGIAADRGRVSSSGRS